MDINIPDFLSHEKSYKIKEKLFKKYQIDDFFIKLDHIGINASILTICSIGSIYLSVFTLFTNQPLFITGVFLHLFFDALDGYSARVNKKNSRLGEFLDHGGDFSSGIFMLVKTYAVLHTPLALIALILFISELLAIYIFKWKYHFPPRFFMFLFLFEWYIPGLIVQILYTPLAFIFSYFKYNRK